MLKPQDNPKVSWLDQAINGWKWMAFLIITFRKKLFSTVFSICFLSANRPVEINFVPLEIICQPWGVGPCLLILQHGDTLLYFTKSKFRKGLKIIVLPGYIPCQLIKAGGVQTHYVWVALDMHRGNLQSISKGGSQSFVDNKIVHNVIISVGKPHRPIPPLPAH